MVRAFSHQCSMQKSKSFHFKRMFDSSPGRNGQSMILDNVNDGGAEDYSSKLQLRSYNSKIGGDRPMENHNIGWALKEDIDPVSCLDVGGRKASSQGKITSADLEMMKERFAKLLLGEDMSGGGKGVSSALALSNAVTNLAASVFGEQKKLEPMPAERKAKWKKEIECLLSVTDHIVEFVPSQQQSKDGTYMEIMVTRQRNDLHINIPALGKLDAMLIACLDNFGNQNEFWYVSREEDQNENGSAPRKDDKWWLPTVKVPQEGLSDVSRKWLQFQKESVNQVLKAAMAINAQILSEMEIPENYIESLPKNGRASLGDSIYKSITDEYFDPAQFLSTMDLSTEHKVLDLKNRIEASIVIWKRKMHHKDGKGSWGSGVSLEKRELFEDRAETILLLLKQRFPGIPQSSLDISKIQFNRDVGHAILESYSRIIESRASTVMSRIEDVLYADSLARTPSQPKKSNRKLSMDSSPLPPKSPKPSPEEVEDLNSAETPTSKTLSDFMGWNIAQGESDANKKETKLDTESYINKEESDKLMSKPALISTKRFSYLEKIENLSGLRSPTARH